MTGLNRFTTRCAGNAEDAEKGVKDVSRPFDCAQGKLRREGAKIRIQEFTQMIKKT